MLVWLCSSVSVPSLLVATYIGTDTLQTVWPELVKLRLHLLARVQKRAVCVIVPNWKPRLASEVGYMSEVEFYGPKAMKMNQISSQSE